MARTTRTDATRTAETTRAFDPMHTTDCGSTRRHDMHTTNGRVVCAGFGSYVGAHRTNEN